MNKVTKDLKLCQICFSFLLRSNIDIIIIFIFLYILYSLIYFIFSVLKIYILSQFINWTESTIVVVLFLFVFLAAPFFRDHNSELTNNLKKKFVIVLSLMFFLLQPVFELVSSELRPWHWPSTYHSPQTENKRHFIQSVMLGVIS